jgi:hypothetical protein
MEQLRAAEYRAKQLAAQQLTVEQQQRAAAMQQATHSVAPPAELHGKHVNCVCRRLKFDLCCFVHNFECTAFGKRNLFLKKMDK